MSDLTEVCKDILLSGIAGPSPAKGGSQEPREGSILSESTGVAQEFQVFPTKAVTYEGGTGVVANRKPPAEINGDTQILANNSTTQEGGEAVSPAAPQVHTGSTIEDLLSTVERITR